MSQKQCARCWNAFECNAQNITQCQCAGIVLSDEQRMIIASLYKDCLCKRCLLMIASSAPSRHSTRLSSDRLGVASPCIGVCTLDDTQHHCTGCFRSLEEIRRWRDLNEQEQEEVVRACSVRKQENS